jgi:6-pyruvoyl-tetrahydropterin synthase related domain
VRKRWHFALGLLLTLGLLWPLLAAPYFSHDDNVQTMRIYEMQQCVKDLQIPCRWVPDLGGGYGYPEFNYYAPLPYYVGDLFYLGTHDIIVAAKLTFATALVLSFVTTYVFASLLWGKLSGSVAAIFFVFAPYHALNLYHRGAMAELWAMAVFPLVFWAFLRLTREPTRWNSLLLGVALALLILSHNLSALLILALLSLLALVLLWQIRSWAYLQHLILAGASALAFSAFYLLPMLLESGFVHLETLTLNEYNYAEHFQSLRDLLLEKPWWLPGNTAEVTHQVGTIHLLAWALSAAAACIYWRKNKQLRFIVVASSVLIVVCIFMMNPASRWIWDRFVVLSFVQFPWRLLTLVSFATSVLAGTSLLLFRSRTRRLCAWFGLVLLVVVMNVGWFRPDRFLNVSQAQLLSDGGWDNLRMYAISDFLPKSAQVAPTQPAPALYEQLSGHSDITDAQSGSNWLKFNAVSDTPATVQIDKFDFPNWEISLDGRLVPHGHDGGTGLLTISLPAGAHSVEAHLRDTPVRVIGNIVSAGALIVCVLVCLRWLPLMLRRSHVPGKRLVLAGEA